MTDCVFCKIVKGEIPCHMVWEDEKYMAFLSISPQVAGMTIVIPKAHCDSYFANTEGKVLAGLMEASQTVARLLDRKLKNVLRTMLIFEGLEVAHLHAKLLPIYIGQPSVVTAPEMSVSNEDLEKTAMIIRE